MNYSTNLSGLNETLFHSWNNSGYLSSTTYSVEELVRASCSNFSSVQVWMFGFCVVFLLGRWVLNAFRPKWGYDRRWLEESWGFFDMGDAFLFVIAAYNLVVVLG